MSRGRPSTTAWAAVAAALLGLLGTAQLTETDLLRLGRAALRAVLQDTSPDRAAPPGRDALTGHPRIADGDTLTLNGTRIRMQGIDALEYDQNCTGPQGRFACGAEGRAALERLIGGRPVTCTPDGSTSHDRIVATCTVRREDGSVLDLNGAMVRSGYAFDCPKFSRGRYAPEERAARAAKDGAWAGRFDYPWSHRDRAGACGR
ncbi:thermonuclease family protein [Roseomonas sp. KE0001]|uniref:thermonuclease family protein n=1 Tax=unclassified Roseomonas TaxID=2617492 RepID=UPI0018DF4586|nr:thermonuclease family protein [Roseomonas sp. KE0001]MBI0433480.1 thermonuclease family protein [Roseomonas sp. KE0001]